MRQDWEPEDLTEVWTLLEDDMKRVRRLELPADLFADPPEKLVDAWRARASKEYPANLERMKPPGPHRAQPAPLPQASLRGRGPMAAWRCPGRRPGADVPGRLLVWWAAHGSRSAG